MKRLPSILLCVAAICFFIAASRGKSPGVFISIGVVFTILAIINLQRARAKL